MIKTLLSLPLVLILLSPLTLFAHSEAPVSTTNTSDSGFEMMRSIEDAALGDMIHEEMEVLMQKMMVNEMNNADITRMTELMNTYPGPYSMMMGRMMGMDTGLLTNNNNMMGGFGGMVGYGTTGIGLMWITQILVWILLILGIVALFKWIQKQK